MGRRHRRRPAGRGGRGARLSQQAHSHRGAPGSRRWHRHLGAQSGRAHDRAAQAGRGGGKPHRCGLARGHRICRARAGRRLHLAHGRHLQYGDEQGAGQEPVVFTRERFCQSGVCIGLSLCTADAPRPAGEQPGRVGRLCQGAARQAELWLRRHGHFAACVGRDPHQQPGAGHDPCAVQGRGTGASGDDGRAARHHV